MEKQQLAAMDLGEGKPLSISSERMKKLADSIKQNLRIS
jgi:hypothetical protein